MKVFLGGIFILWFALGVHAQELNCNVVINGERVQTQDRQIFDKLQNSISQFLNNNKWTKDEFKENERIKCNILITLRKGSVQPNFQADVQIQSMRPVFNTEYETPLLNFLDSKWSFQYTQDQPLNFSENNFTTELTSLLAFYAYVIIGLDYDSFAPKGGDPYFQRALLIANNSQQISSSPGWSTGGDTRDRYWITDNLNSPQFDDFRQALYQYHRAALDDFDADQDAARLLILEALEKIQRVRQVAATSAVLNSFFDAKQAELINIFSQGNMEVRTKAVDILSRVDPSNASNYRKAIK